MTNFLDRFSRARLDPQPQSLQLLFFEPPAIDPEALRVILRVQHHLPDVTCDWEPVSSLPSEALKQIISPDGPPASHLGLIAWGPHQIKIAQFQAPMPYGPVESCVMPALIPPPMKVDARQHQAHTLLYYAGSDPDPHHRFAALCTVAGALAQFDAIVVLNEEARAAAPAFDLIPDEGENPWETYLQLPIPYLLGGFCKLTFNDDDSRPMVRTFANHRLGLPNLARYLTGHDLTAESFRLFSAMLGYLRANRHESFSTGDTVDFGIGSTMTLRPPRDDEWYLESYGPIFVLESSS